MAAARAGRATGIEPRVPPGADATRELFERYSGQIFGYCLHRLGNREEAEDAVQSTFLNAFRGLARGVVPQSESAWLFKIAENVCHSRHRSSWRRGRIESPSDLDSFQDVLPAPPRAQDELIPLGEALERLPENQRRAILLREWQGLSYREIAQELEVSQSAVETLIFRARRSLVEGLEAPLPPRRKALRRASHGLDVGGLIGALKVFFAGGAAVKVAAVAVAVTGATVAVGHRHHAVRGVAPAVRAPARARVSRPAPSVVAPRVVVPAAPKPKPAPIVRRPLAQSARGPAFAPLAVVPAVASPSRGEPATTHHPPAAPTRVPTIEHDVPPVQPEPVHPAAPPEPAAHEEPAPATTTAHEPPPEPQPTEEPPPAEHPREPTTTTRPASARPHEAPHRTGTTR